MPCRVWSGNMFMQPAEPRHCPNQYHYHRSLGEHRKKRAVFRLILCYTVVVLLCCGAFECGAPLTFSENILSRMYPTLSAAGALMWDRSAQGSGVNDTELCDVLVDQDIFPDKPAHKAGADAARAWITSRG